MGGSMTGTIYRGTIHRLDPRGFGFVRSDDGIEWFFPAKHTTVPFDTLTLGQRVEFVLKLVAHKGLRAFSVTPTVAQVAA